MAASRRKGIIAVIIVMMVALVAVTAILLFSSRTVSVRFETGNGPAISNIVLKVGETAERPADPVHDDPGYSFGGWYMDENYTVEFDWDMPIEQTTTVFVKWRAESFTVRVLRKTNGGFDEILYRATGDYTSTITLPTENTAEAPNEDLDPVYNFQRYNQNFIGFSYDSNADGDFSVDLLPGSTFTIPNKDTQLYAIFRGKESSFQFDSNNASGLVGDQTGYFNEYFTVPSSEGLSYKYYTFVEWNTVRDGSGDSYLPGQQIKITSLNPVTLYAIWERNQVNVCVDAMGGTGSIGADGTNLYDAGTQFDLTTIAQPTREGYRLMSYNSQPDGLGVTYALDEVINLEEDDVTLYAVWAKLITVTYDYNGVESDIVIDGFTGIAGESFTLPSLNDYGITRNNFEFQGWSLDQLANDAAYKAGNTFTISTEYTRDVVLYAVWLGVPRTLVFDNNGGGNGNTEVNKTHGFRYQIDKQAQNIDKGYKFVGWNTQPDGKGVTYQVGEIFVIGNNLNSDGDSVLFAMWEPETFTISYYLQGGVCSFDPSANPYVVNVDYKTELTLIHATTAVYREGYRFMGWGLSANSIEPEYYDVENGTGWDISMPANNLMLFALWEKEYTITFDSNGGSGLVTPINNIILGETFTLPTTGYSRENYTQIYWSNATTNGVEYALGETITFENSAYTTMYAIWQGNARHIYVYDNLDNSNYARDIVGRYGEKMTIEYEIEITNSDLGYELAGFGENAYATVDNIRYHYGDVINAPTSESINIYAVWTKKSFEVLYELEGGSYDGSSSMSDYNITKVYQETSYIPQLTPTKEKHTFLGWCEDPNGTGPLYQPNASFTIPSHDIIFYAIWARSYTLSFDGNGGELADPDVPVNEITKGKGSTIILNDATIGGSFQKEHYEFVGWNTRQDGLGDDYAQNSSFTLNSDTVLYAKWQGVLVPLSINTGSTTNITIAPTPRYGEIVDLSTRIITPPRDGLELAGFADEDDPDTVVWTTEYEVNDVNRNIIYAVWTPKSYILIIRLEGGMYDRSYEDIKQTILFETEINLANYSSGITQTGYKLVGYKNKQSVSAIDYALDDTFTMPAANTTIYCHWEKLAVYTFNTNMGDASTNEVREYVVGDIDTSPVLTREFYTFVGWSQSQTATTADSGMFSGNQFTVIALVDITYYAVWIGDSRTVVLDPNGAVGLLQSQISCNYGDTIDLTNRTLTRSDTNGYEFAGWSTTSGDNAANTISGGYVVECSTAEVTLYAVWARRNFTIRFYNNGKQVKALTRQYEAVIELTGTDFEITQKGYTFLGWAESDLEQDTNKMYTTTKPFTVPDADVNLYAIWDAQEVNIYFENDDDVNPNVVYVGQTNTNGGYFLEVGLKDLTITMPSNYQSAGNGMYRTRYRFIGWKLEISGVLQSTLYEAGQSFTVFQENPDDEIHFLAQWEINKIDVLIDAAGGSIVIDEHGSVDSYKKEKIVESEALTLPTEAEITRSGHRLMYFKTQDGTTYPASTETTPSTIVITTSLMTNNLVTVTAVWIPQYTLTFAINVPAAEITSGVASGSTTMAPVDSGLTVNLPESGFSRTNYHFVEWNTNALGTGISYDPGDTVQVSDNITYYAIWLGNERSVVFDFNGGTCAGVDGEGAGLTTYTLNTTFGATVDLVNFQGVNITAGKILSGWKRNASDTALYKRATEKYVVEGTDDSSIIYLYAHWDNQSYEITYDANGGIFYTSDGNVETRTNTVTFESDVVISRAADWVPSNPEKNTPAYTFVGWAYYKTTSYNATTSESLTEVVTLNENIIYTPGVENDNKIHAFKMPAKHIVLYAIWKPIDWTITYTKEDGTTFQSDTQAYGKTITLIDGPEKTDHLFTAWEHTLADGSTEQYQAGAFFTINHDIMTDNEKATYTIILKPIYTPQSVRVRIIANDGMFTDGSDQKIIDTFVGHTITMPMIQEPEGSEYQLTRAYYALVGFSEDQGGNGDLQLEPGQQYIVPSLNSSLVLGGELIIYAKWTGAEAYIYKGDDENLNAYYATLKAAISDANDGDIVYLLANSTISQTIGIQKTITLLLDGTMLSSGSTMTISRASGFTDNMFSITPLGNLVIGYEDNSAPLELVINGNNRVTNAAAIFNVQGRLSIYDGVTITGARGISGGAIYVNANAASVTLKYCTLQGNNATNGGAIYIEQGELVIDESTTLTANQATSNGGAVYSKGSVSITEEEGYSKGIVITDNSADGKGGAFYNDGGLVFASVTLENNYAANGGAIYNGTSGTISLTRVEFYLNNVSSKGGAIYNDATALSANNATIIECKFGADTETGNTAAENGGAICNAGRMEISEGTEFTGNSTTQPGSSGGAVANEGAGILVITGTTFYTNGVALNGQGGAFSLLEGEATLGIAGNEDSLVYFEGNTSISSEGLAIYVKNGTLHLNNVEIAKHVYEGSTYLETHYGGTVYVAGGTVNVNSALIYENSTTNNGGAILATSGTLNINNAEIYSNVATNGGAIYARDSAIININKANIYSNSATPFTEGAAGQGLGGAIYTSSANVSLLGGVIGQEGEGANTAVNGGAIYATAQITINGATIAYNVASANGGGIWASGNVILITGEFKYNIAQTYGGAIYTSGTSIVKFQGDVASVQYFTRFEGNTFLDSDGAGYGIYAVNSVEVQGTIIFMITLGNDDIYLDNLNDDGSTKDIFVLFKNNLTSQCRINVSSENAAIGVKLADMVLPTRAKNYLKYFAYQGNAGGVRAKDRYIINGDYSATIGTGDSTEYYSSLRLAYNEAEEGDVIAIARDIDLYEDLRTDEAIDSSADYDTAFDIQKTISIISEAEYTISRGAMTGYMFEVMGTAQFTLGMATDDESELYISGGYDPTVGGDSLKSIINVQTGTTFYLYPTVTLKNNIAHEGGAITNSGTTNLYGGLITENFASSLTDDESAVDGMGGAIYNLGTLNVGGDANISLNESNAYGGGIYNNAGTVNINTANALITENMATISGGGVYVNAGALNLEKGKISYNTTDATKVGSDTYAPGGAGVAISGGGTLLMTSSSTGEIINNTAKSNGGGVALYNGTINIQKGTIKDNRATNGFGGGVYLIKTADTDTHVLTLGSGAVITTNRANYGGGVAFIGITMEITSYLNIYGNTGDIRGGGVILGATTSYGANITFNSEYITIGKSGAANLAQDGAGIYIFNGATLTISKMKNSENNAIAYNTATGNGGGIYNDGTLTFKNSDGNTGYYYYINGNTAANGAGIYNDSKGVVVANNLRIRANTATSTTGGGGGIYNKNSFTIDQYKDLSSYIGGVQKTPNIATNGGGIYNEGTFLVKTYLADADSTDYNGRIVISYNESTDYGAGIYNAKGSFTVTNCIMYVNNNEQTNDVALFGGGAGITMVDGTFTSLSTSQTTSSGLGWTNTLVYSNAATGYGGGWLIQGGTVTMNRTEIYSNSSRSSGGGLAVIGGNLIFSECTGWSGNNAYIYKNTASVKGAEMYLNVPITYKQNMQTSSTYMAGTVYLNSTSAYIKFEKTSSGTTSYVPSNASYKVQLESNSAGLVDGRRLAFFGTYQSEEDVTVMDEEGNEKVEKQIVENNLAEKYYTRFDIVLPENVVFGVNFDDKGFVVLSAPVARNWNNQGQKITKQYYATLAQAVAEATNGQYIEILRSHTLYTNVVVENKGIVFVQQSDIILTRSKSLVGAPILLINTDTSKNYDVYFNYSTTQWSTTFGAGTTLTFDGNQSLNKNNACASFIISTGYTKRNSDGSISHGTYAYYWYYGINRPGDIDLTITNCRFVNNRAYAIGGALSYYGYNGDGTSNSTYNAHKSSTLKIVNTTFENNKTICQLSNEEEQNGKFCGGGAILAEGGILNIEGCAFNSNSTKAVGGAIRAVGQARYDIDPRYSGPSYSSIIIRKTTFSDNFATYHAGALMIQSIYNSIELGVDSSSETNTESVSFVNNKTEYYHGGAVYYRPMLPSSFETYRNNISNTSYTNTSITWNTAMQDCDTYRKINKYNPGEWVSFMSQINNNQIVPILYLRKTCTIDGNMAGYYSGNANGYGSALGGGVLSYNGLGLYGALITNNVTGGSGGGVYALRLVVTSGSNTISNNTALQSNGGGLYFTNSARGNPHTIYTNYTGGMKGINDAYISEKKGAIINLQNFVITGNTSKNAGGGVYTCSGISIEGATISNNTSTASAGGGIYLYSGASNNYLYNAIISGNTAKTYGGGIASYYHEIVVWDVQLSDNTAGTQGGGLYMRYGGVVYSCDIFDNEVTGTGWDYGGGGIWHYYNKLRICADTTIINNKLSGTAGDGQHNCGGGGIWSYANASNSQGYLQIGNLYYDTTYTYADTGMANVSLYSSANQNTMVSFGYFNYKTPTDVVYTTNYIPCDYYGNANTTEQHLLVDNVLYRCSTTNTTKVAGNTVASGYGDGFFCIGQNYFSLVIAGNPNVEDKMYIQQCGIFLPTYVGIDASRSFSIDFPNSITGYDCFAIGKGVKASLDTLSMFRALSPANASIKIRSGYDITKTTYVRRCYLAIDSITFVVYDNSYLYQHANNDVNVDDYPLITMADIKNGANTTGYFPTTPTSGSYLNNNTNDHFKTVIATVGQSYKSIYDQLNLVKPGASFFKFYCYQKYNTSNWTAYTDQRPIWFKSLSDRILTQAEYEAAGISSDNGIALFVSWTNTQYKITIQKILDNKTVRDSYRCAESQTGGKTGGNFTFYVYTNDTFQALIDYVNNTKNTITNNSGNSYVNPITGETVPINYYEGYTYQYFTLAIDRKTYKPTDKYPYVADATLYLVYYKTEYTLTYDIGEESTVEIEGTTYNIGGGAWTAKQVDEETGSEIKQRYQTCLSDKSINMLSASMIEKDGCKLVGWYSADSNKVYNLTASHAIRQNLGLVPVWEPVPYTLRVYYNYPTGGSSFMLYSVNGNTSILRALTNFQGTIEGYTPNGFAFDAEGNDMITDTDMMPSHDQMVYAQWAPIDVTITYLKADGSTYTTQTVKFGKAFKLLETMPDGSPKKIWQNQGSNLTYAPGATYVVENLSSLYLRFRAGS